MPWTLGTCASTCWSQICTVFTRDRTCFTGSVWWRCSEISHCESKSFGSMLSHLSSFLADELMCIVILELTTFSGSRWLWFDNHRALGVFPLFLRRPKLITLSNQFQFFIFHNHQFSGLAEMNFFCFKVLEMSKKGKLGKKPKCKTFWCVLWSLDC